MGELKNIKTYLAMFSTNIKAWRIKENLSKRALAKKLNIAESTIRNLETSPENVTVATLSKYRQVYCISFVSLFQICKEINNCTELNLQEIKRNEINDVVAIGKRIQDIRKFRQIQLEELAILSRNMDNGNLSKYEAGKINIELVTLTKIADGLEVTLLELLDLGGSMPKNKFVGSLK